MSTLFQKFDFSGKRVLIFGGLDTLGFAAVKKFVEQRAEVIVVDQNETRLEDVKKNFPHVTIIHVESGNWEPLENVVLNNMPVHHIVYDMPIWGKLSSFMEYSEEDFAGAYDANLTPIIPIGQAFARGVLHHSIKDATIVCVSSISAAHPMYGTLLWGSSKGGLESIARIMARDLAGFNIRVNTVRPAACKVAKLVDAPKEKKIELSKVLSRHVGQKLVDPEEVADAVMILSSSIFPSMTGTILEIDAGYAVM